MNNDYIKRASCEVSSKYNSLHEKNPIMFPIVSEAKIRKKPENGLCSWPRWNRGRTQ